MTLEYSLSLNRVFLFQDDGSGEDTHSDTSDETHSDEADTTLEGEEAHSAEEDVVNPVIPELPEIFWALGLFAALYFLMRYVLVPPVKARMVERENMIRDAKDAADKVASEMGSAQADYDAAVAGARDEASALIDAARDEANAYRAERQAVADAEIASMKGAAAEEIAAAHSNALTAMRGDVSSMAVAAASSVVGKSIDAGSAQATIDAILDGGAS